MSWAYPVLLSLSIAGPIQASDRQLTRLVDTATLRGLASELSGESAKRNLDTITLWHRTRASRQFRNAAEHILAQLQQYGFGDAEILTFPADGKTLFGTQKSRPAWDVDFAELWEVTSDGHRLRRLGHWESMPLSLAQDSLSGAVTAPLVDIGAGTAESNYQGLAVAGKLVLTSSQPQAVADLAVATHGAASARDASRDCDP